MVAALCGFGKRPRKRDEQLPGIADHIHNDQHLRLFTAPCHLHDESTIHIGLFGKELGCRTCEIRERPLRLPVSNGFCLIVRNGFDMQIPGDHQNAFDFL